MEKKRTRQRQRRDELTDRQTSRIHKREITKITKLCVYYIFTSLLDGYLFLCMSAFVYNCVCACVGVCLSA